MISPFRQTAQAETCAITAPTLHRLVSSSLQILHKLQTGSEAQPISYPIGCGSFSPRVGRSWHEADHLPPSSAKVNNGGAIPPLLLRLHGVVINWFSTLLILLGSCDSVVGIATDYGLDDRVVGVRVPVGQEFSLLHVVQTGSKTHPVSYPMDIGALSLGVKRPWREADHSPPTSAEAKKIWIYTSTPSCVFMT
jgi:hypothetical protein